MAKETLTIEQLAEELRIARRDMDRAKALYANRMANYDDMAAAAKKVSDLVYRYSCLKMPGRSHRRIPYQAILR